MTSKRVAFMIACILFTVSLYAQGLRHGITNEEFNGDVVVQSISPYKILMGIDGIENGRDGVADHLFAVRSETKFPQVVSMRLDNAHVVIAADHVIVRSEDGRVVVFTTNEQCAACSFATNDRLYRFSGFEVVRRADRLPPFKSQKKLRTGGASTTVEPSASKRPRNAAPTESFFIYDPPVDYWDPCAPDAWGNVPAICAGGSGGGGNPKPAQDCQSGGTGSTSCSLTGCTALFGTSPGCSASCKPGYYSCCYCDMGTSNCGCYKE